MYATAWHRKHRLQLTSDQLTDLESTLGRLQAALSSGNRKDADIHARYLEAAYPQCFRKSVGLLLIQLALLLIIVLAGSLAVRQMGWELFQIPTGSMRPTLLENDHVLVSKTSFGLNSPIATSHLYFDPTLIERGEIVVWSGNGIDLPDTDSLYLGLIPSKKRYIKRLVGKPGDTLYFYGGKIYGIDRNGHDISPQLQAAWMNDLEYIPFSTFEGRITTKPAKGSHVVQEIYLNHMGQAIGRLALKGYGVVQGDISVSGKWIEDNFLTLSTTNPTIETYSDFWGIGNYAMARLLTKEQVRKLTDVNPDDLQDTVLYLELRHSPNLKLPKPRFQEAPDGRIHFVLTPYVTVMPLQEKHLSRLMESMYTSRFVVQDGKAMLYTMDANALSPNTPLFSTIPDGTYEMYCGKAYSIDSKGSRKELPKDHPLYRKTPTNVQQLFNLGIEFDIRFAPTKNTQVNFPSRYAYFRDGNLYVMGSPLLFKEEADLKHFLIREQERQKHAAPNQPYTAFADQGPPVGENGRSNKQFISNFGLKVPDRHYLVLGDNHARSADSRYFGFVPEENLQGTATQIFWPRWHVPAQPALPWITLPRVLVWTILCLLAALFYCFYYRRRQLLFTRH